jgi:hypothetical protein
MGMRCFDDLTFGQRLSVLRTIGNDVFGKDVLLMDLREVVGETKYRLPRLALLATCVLQHLQHLVLDFSTVRFTSKLFFQIIENIIPRHFSAPFVLQFGNSCLSPCILSCRLLYMSGTLRAEGNVFLQSISCSGTMRLRVSCLDDLNREREQQWLVSGFEPMNAGLHTNTPEPSAIRTFKSSNHQLYYQRCFSSIGAGHVDRPRP